MQKGIDEQALMELISPDRLVFVPGASGAPSAFMDALLREPHRSEGLRMLTTYVPGINRLEIDAMAPSARVTGLFMQEGLGAAQRDGRFGLLALSYSGFARHLHERVDIDLAVVQLSMPDAQGRCSLGPAVEFTPIALRKSRRVIGMLNHQTPRIPGAPSLHLDDLDHICEVDVALPRYMPTTDALSQTLGAHIAPFIEDGCALQLGLGKVPTALTAMLTDRKRLRLHSGMLSDGLVDLAEAGALDPDFIHTSCVLVGSERLYRAAPDIGRLRLASCDVTHHPATLAGIGQFVAVNSALEVDLFGQCNLEHASGRSVSGAGGAPDFARAAHLSPRGCSIVALNATFGGGTGSRIVPALTDRAITTLARTDVDLVITEFGVARLSGATVHERAQALIAVAAPEFRGELEREWRAICARL